VKATCKKCGAEGIAEQAQHSTFVLNCKACSAFGFAGKPPAKSKYGNQRVYSVEHGTFDSKMEFKRFGDLLLLLKAGQITDLRRQVRYKLEHQGIFYGIYIADFVYQQGDQTIVEDVKGHKTQAYRTKKKLMKSIHGIDILETSS
jgi:hypothetical protein